MFGTLALLVQNSGHLLEKDELMKRVWPDACVEESSLTRNVSTLRKILGDGARLSF
jgi:DNA-binding winged helix-turn-helix (wHTH) protein